jgi:cyclopropane-fatty-acyl-phospholipid synthase
MGVQRWTNAPSHCNLNRDVDERFDKTVSVGMFEHARAKTYPTFFDVVNSTLKPDGLFLLHSIGNYLTTACES